MKSRRNIKVTTDMFEDTKFKIIDTKPERDLIHYVWFRTLTLAGKVNRNGELYLSSNIPYTLETLAIEFNRDTAEIKYALGVLIELEMICRNESRVYKVKNFAKHQNIKIQDIKAQEIPKETQGIKIDNDEEKIKVDTDNNKEIDKNNKTNNIVNGKENSLKNNLKKEKITESINDNEKDDELGREQLSKDKKSISEKEFGLDKLQMQKSVSYKGKRKGNSKKKKGKCHLTKEDEDNEILSIKDEKDIGDLGTCISCWTF